MKYVYHSSPTQEFKEIKKNNSMDRGEYVFGSPHLEVSAAFLGRKGGDFTCGLGHEDNGKMYLCERFQGALEYRYNKPGSIYFLDSVNFREDKNLWWAEVISDRNEEVLKEMRIERPVDFLYELQEKGKLDIYRYPDRPAVIPDNDFDLVDRAIHWSRAFGEDVLRSMKKYHPHLMDKVISQL
jgi:hypothetical protein